jgi:hypothetical protein
MRPGARHQYAKQLRELSRVASEIADKMEVAELPDLRHVSVGYDENGCRIDVGGTYAFQMPRDKRHIIDILHGLAWGLFESQRTGSNPSDPEALEEVRSILRNVGESILRSWQPRCSKCDGLQHICVVCDGECKVSSNAVRIEGHDMRALCPECSAWLTPGKPL